MKRLSHATLLVTITAVAALFAEPNSSIQFYEEDGSTETAQMGWDGDNGSFYIETPGSATPLEMKNGDLTVPGEVTAERFNGDGGGLSNLPSTRPNGAAGGDLSGTYPNPSIGNGKVSTNKLDNDAVTSSKLADDAVTTSKIDNNAVTSSKIANGTVREEDLDSDLEDKVNGGHSHGMSDVTGLAGALGGFADTSVVGCDYDSHHNQGTEYLLTPIGSWKSVETVTLDCPEAGHVLVFASAQARRNTDAASSEYVVAEGTITNGYPSNSGEFSYAILHSASPDQHNFSMVRGFSVSEGSHTFRLSFRSANATNNTHASIQNPSLAAIFVKKRL